MLVRPEPDEPVELHPSIPVYWSCPHCGFGQFDSYRYTTCIVCRNCDIISGWDDVLSKASKEYVENAMKEMDI